MSSMPEQKPGRSEQNVGTPKEFLRALKHKLGIKYFDIDLAASFENTVACRYYDEKDDALVQPWKQGIGWDFCNPPYGHLEPWVEKALHESEDHDAQIAMLVPASVGSNWWWKWVHEMAYVIFLNGRITFEGHETPYPKDLAVLLYAPMFELNGGYSVWPWKETV